MLFKRIHRSQSKLFPLIGEVAAQVFFSPFHGYSSQWETRGCKLSASESMKRFRSALTDMQFCVLMMNAIKFNLDNISEYLQPQDEKRGVKRWLLWRDSLR